ncbi:MAG: ECF transporter S component [Actinobacteria bacterium]|nr:ECF transporter S component [Actinomycetota bacterium]
MKWSRAVLFFLAVFISTWIAGGSLNVKFLNNLAMMSLACVVFILLYYYIKFEEKKADAKTIALLGALSALSIAGRVLFAPIPNIQPSTFIIIVSGYVFGPVSGFMVGATTALVSNFMLGHGPWTVWQMLAWGLAGLSAGFMGRGKLLDNRWRMSLFCGSWGFLYGWILNAYFLLGFIHPLNLQAVLATYGASFWFDLLHAGGNFAFAFLMGPALIEMLARYKARFSYELSDDLMDNLVASGERGEA